MTRRSVLAVLFAGIVLLGSAPLSVVGANGPTAEFSYSPSSPNPDDTITLDASGSDGSITSYEWDTDGDGYYGEYDDAADGQTTSVSFDTGGTYTVGLEVTDSNGNTDTMTTQITVENPAPTVEFSYSPATPNPDDTISLDASDSSDADGSITSYEWDTDGDGYYDEYDDADDGQTTRVSFDTAGTYTVGLRVTDNGESSVTQTEQITVENPAPTANFSYQSTSSDGLTVALDGSDSSDPDGRIVEYDWYVDGDHETSGPTPTLDFYERGTYTVRLEVTDNGGTTHSTSETVSVSQSPTAAIDAPDVPIAVESQVRLSGTQSADPDGTVESYRWTFSDGSTQRGETVSKRFTESGSHAVELTVTDSSGNTDTTETTVHVEVPPEISVSWTPTGPADDEPVRFEASSESAISEYNWDFDGDGRVDETGASVEHAFPDAGERDVTLTAIGPNGLEVTVERTVSVRNVRPTAEFSWRPDPPRSGQDVVLEANSSDEIETFAWDFDNDGEVDAEGPTVTHSFPSDGKQTVVLSVTDEHGDTASFSEVVTLQQSATFEIASERSDVAPGDELLVQFSMSNLMPDEQVRIKLNLDLPESGVSISGVDGGNLASRSSTEFITVGPGESDNIQLRLQMNDPGNYSINGTAVYYLGEAGTDDRRTSRVGPAEITVAERGATSGSGSEVPGFGIPAAAAAVVLVGLYARFRSRLP